MCHPGYPASISNSVCSARSARTEKGLPILGRTEPSVAPFVQRNNNKEHVRNIQEEN